MKHRKVNIGIRFDAVDTKTIRSPGGFISPNKAVCLLIKGNSIETYSDLEGESIWQVHEFYLKFHRETRKIYHLYY